MNMEGGQVAGSVACELPLGQINESWVEDILCIQQQTARFKEIHSDLQLHVNELLAENKRLTTQLKNGVQMQMETVQHERSLLNQKNIQQISQHQQQLLESVEEKESVVEMWHLALKEIDRLEQQLVEEKFHPEAKLLRRQLQQMQEEHRVVASQLMTKLVNAEEQHRSREIEIIDLRNECEKTSKTLLEKQRRIDALIVKESLQECKLKELSENNDILQKRIQTTILEVTNLDNMNTEMTSKLSSLERKVHELEAEKMAVIKHSKLVIEIVENGLLEKDHALVQESRSKMEVLRLQKDVAQLMEEAGVRTKKQVDSVKKSCNEITEHLLDKVKNLQMKCNEKQIMLDRAVREKKLAAERVEQMKQHYEREELQFHNNIERLREQLSETVNARETATERYEEIRNISIVTEKEYESRCERLEHEKRSVIARLEEVTSQCEKLIDEKNQLITVEKKIDDNDHEETICKLKQQTAEAEEEWKFEREMLEGKVSILDEKCRMMADELKAQRNTSHKAYIQWRQNMSKSNECLRKRLLEVEAQLLKQKAYNDELKDMLYRDQASIIKAPE